MKNKLAIAFLVQTWQGLEETFHHQIISDDPEDYERCIARQQYVEIQVCERMGITYFYLLHSKETQNNEFPIGEEQAICYDYQAFNKNRKEMDSLEGYAVFLRTNCFEILKPLQDLAKIGAKNLTTWEDDQILDRWYQYVSIDFTKRNITGITKSQITPDLLKKYSDKRDKVFIKTRFKGENFVTDTSISHFKPRSILENMESNKPLLISEPLDLCKDDKGKLEYRVWVANQRVSSISRYLDYDTDYNIPAEIQIVAEKFIAAHKSVFPDHYCLDIGLDYWKGPVIIELNGLNPCGRYEKNDFEKFLQDIIPCVK